MIDETLVIEDEWTDSAENEPDADEWPDDDIYRGEGDLEC